MISLPPLPKRKMLLGSFTTVPSAGVPTIFPQCAASASGSGLCISTSAQAGVYSSVTHYLQAVKAAGTTDAAAVMKVMKETPINDMFAKNGRIREDGRMVHDMYLFEVKKPSESKGRWDDYKLLATVPGDQAFQPLADSRCPLVKK